MYRTLYGNKDKNRVVTQIAMEMKSKVFDQQLVQTVLTLGHLWADVNVIFQKRQNGTAKPKGHTENGKWRPDYDEMCPYCKRMVKSKKATRRHCNSKRHIASVVYMAMLEEHAEMIYEAVASVVQRNKRPTPNEALLAHHFGHFLERFTVEMINKKDER